MVIPIGRRAVDVVREATEKTSAWVKLALALSVAALALAAAALFRAVKVA